MSLNIQNHDSEAANSQAPATKAIASKSASVNFKALTNCVLIFIALGFFWFRLIDNLRLTWATDPQYGYGWLVPLLCLGLVVRRWSFIREPGSKNRENQHTNLAVFLFLILGLLYLPTRLIEAAVPEWRPIEWLLGIEAIGLTLCAIYLGKGRNWFRQLAFPILFFLVAIPWPSLIETPIIQALTRVSAATVVQLLGWLGIPALTHGNVIQVATGMVGIDDACSGIRSFQSSIMISLFLGELYGLNWSRRVILILFSFFFSMTFNIFRMSLLTIIAAKEGVAAISRYHDETGITIAIACTLALWGLAVLFKKYSVRGGKPLTSAHAQGSIDGGEIQKSTIQKSAAVTPGIEESSLRPVVGAQRTLSFLAIGLLTWLVVVEVGVQLWYRHIESHLIPGPNWTVNFPTNNPTFKVVPIDDSTRRLLRFDEGKQGIWSESDGSQWQVFYFNWRPGRVAGYLAKRHTPEICLQATGLKMLDGPKLKMMSINGVELPMRSYLFQSGRGLLHVYHCIWDNGANMDAYVRHESARFNLIRSIWTGRGNKGQKVLEVIVVGINDPERLKAAVRSELAKMIKVEKPMVH